MHPDRIPSEVEKHGADLACVKYKKRLAEENTKVLGETIYTVKEGDTLWGIAENHYGSGFLWRKIAEANPDKVKYRDNDIVIILPGHKLILPAVDLNEANPEANPKPLAAKTPADVKANHAIDGVACPNLNIKIDPEALKVPFEVPFGPNKFAKGTLTYELDVACQKQGPINFSTEISKDSLVVKADIHNFIASMGVTTAGKVTMDAGFKFSFLGADYDASLAISEYRFTPLPGYKATPLAFKGSKKNQVIKQNIGNTAFEGKAGVTIYLEVFDKINNNNENTAQEANLSLTQWQSSQNESWSFSNNSDLNFTKKVVFGTITTIGLGVLVLSTLPLSVSTAGAAGLITFYHFTENYPEWGHLQKNIHLIDL